MTLPSSSRQTDTDPPSITTINAHQTHIGKRKRKQASTSSSSTTTTAIETASQPTKRIRRHHSKLIEQKQRTPLERKHEIDHLETTLDYLKTDCILIDVVLKSLQSFFPIRPMTTEEQLEQVDKELGLAYDDMLNQIRALYRNVVKLDRAIKAIPSSYHAPSP